MDWRIDPTFSFNFEQVTTVLDMPKGSQNVYIGLLDFQINFTPDMQLRTQVQYDNITKQMSVLARYNWEYEPGQEIFASVGDTSIVDGTLFKPNYHARTTQAIIRRSPRWGAGFAGRCAGADSSAPFFRLAVAR